jgi:hypothetical protein
MFAAASVVLLGAAARAQPATDATGTGSTTDAPDSAGERSAAEAPPPPGAARPAGAVPTPSGTPAPAAPRATEGSAAAASTPTPSTAQSERPRDAYDLTVRSETYLELFERALLPGTGGAIVVTESFAPIHEYLFFRGDRLDAPWADDALDFELQAWGAATFVGDDLARDPDGDVPVANVSARFGPARVRVGRQVETGGAARFARFDGAEARLRTESGFSAFGYGGLTVRPRWSARPGYYQLGSATDTLLETPDALPEAGRSGNWLAGGGLGYAHEDAWSVQAALHEQREAGAVDRREVAADVHLTPDLPLEIGGDLFFDLDGQRISEGSGSVDLFPTDSLTVLAEARHVTPSLLLGKQSVLSVFDAGAFDELGAEARYEATSRLGFRAGQYVTWLGADDLGWRSRLGLRARPEPSGRLVIDVDYGRVTEPENGYHSTRVAARYAIAAPVVLTGEHDAYFYDRSIGGLDLSSVEAVTVELAPAPPLRILLGGTLSQTPYAVNDAQALLRVAYRFDHEDAP